ncbi:peptidoglycan-binding domain-containing protein [Hydrocarboniphaga sp.]|uniref:peptidoglycan-binding domain-containing protein n=1 Tax=Hydrocarboniphaga sp. TaxID=2033016 RepID=UPI003D10B416
MNRKLRRAALLFASGLLCFAASAAEDGLLLAEPPRAQPGECWAQLVQPARYQRKTESVLKTPAGERVQTVPARYQWVEKTEIRPAGKRRVVTRAAEYEVSEEQVLVRPAGSHDKVRPAQYKTIEERVVTRTGTVLKPDPVSGEMCAVEGPVEFQIVKRKLLVEPARSEPVEQPAVYKTVRHRKLITPAETKLVDAPERSIKRRVRELVEPARQIRIPTPPVYEDVVRVIEVAPARNQWVSVVCDTNATPQLLRRVQQALASEGFNPGATDGRWNSRSGQALRAYQDSKGLTQGGLTVETLQALGLTLSS